jgi:hypothetical protein
MTDWTAVARARGIEIPEGAEGRLIGPLVALEETFRPLVHGLSPLMEPDCELHLEEEGE